MNIDLKTIWNRLPSLIPDHLSRISEVAGSLSHFGWAEANAGNLSINITEVISGSYPDTAQEDISFYLVSRSGSRYRQMQHNPLESMVLISLSIGGISIYPEPYKPTSEWLSHLSIQQLLSQKRPEYKVVLHSHPTELIVLSSIIDGGNTKELQQTLYNVLPELSFYLPEGIAWCDYRLPGSEDLNKITMDRMEDKKALVWSKHGLLCFGKDIDEAFDYMEIVNKAAKVLLLVREFPQK